MNELQLPSRIVEALQQALPDNQGFISLHEPTFRGNEWNYVKECLDTGWVSSAGKYVEDFELKLAEYTGSPYAIVVSNGTSALHVCLMLAGVQANDEVLMPSLTFVATANAVSYCGAVPHFIDVSPVTMGVDPIALDHYLQDIAVYKDDGAVYNKQTGRRIAAIVPMHTFGHPVDLDPLMEVCERYRITLVEDAAESIGSYYKGKHTGTFGKLGAVSFNGNKIITTGGGGAILTSDETLAKAAKHLTTTAKLPHRWEFHHDQIGYNYRMPNLNAALGCAQLERLPIMLEQKRTLVNKYAAIFESILGVSLFMEPSFASSNYWLNAIVLDEPSFELRDQILEVVNNAGLMTRPIWTPMHELPMFKDCPSMQLPVTNRLAASVINIPSSASLCS
ncbi:LegC family aminotransferase [Paenibacillus sp. PR3]|uniref:LegC family aminotransferase n=1 Tax=Paenibacillus terricola TaxID=2763503 RepID=A0ABR8MXK4_9BACL|nr:LegC family aminotransferase [Paenibacillus terricola]MBD3920696.1 LegC family aminotransferase [Paenibacillus terricola]